MRKSSPQTQDEKAIYAEIGIRIREARRSLGLEQKDLALAVDMARTSILNIEQGRQSVSVHALYKISHALGIDVTALLPEDSDAIDG